MNELERLRYLVETGQATPEEARMYAQMNTSPGSIPFIEGAPAASPNELERLQQIISSGMATPEQIGRYNQLNIGPTTSANPFQKAVDQNQPTPFLPEGMTYSSPGDWRQKPVTTGAASIVGLSPASFSTREAYIQYVNETTGKDSVSAGEEWDAVMRAKEEGTQQPGQKTDFFPFIYPGGSDISTELYTLGRALGADKGAQGRTLTGVSAAGAALFDIGRNVLSGMGYEKRNQYVEDYYRKKQQEQNYTPNPQSQGINTTGGWEAKNGGKKDPPPFNENFPSPYIGLPPLNPDAVPGKDFRPFSDGNSMSYFEALSRREGVTPEELRLFQDEEIEKDLQYRAKRTFAVGGAMGDTVDPTMIATAQAQYPQQLQAWKGLPRGSQGEPWTEDNYVQITPAQRAARMKELASMDPSEVQYTDAEEYAALASGKEYWINPFIPENKALFPPVDWNVAKASLPAGWVAGSTPPPAPSAPAVNKSPVYVIKRSPEGPEIEVSYNDWVKFKGMRSKYNRDDQGNPIRPMTGGQNAPEFIPFNPAPASNPPQQPTPPPMENGGAFRMKGGGIFDKQVGDTVTFIHKGEKKTGVIKEIKPDGKIVI